MVHRIKSVARAFTLIAMLTTITAGQTDAAEVSKNNKGPRFDLSQVEASDLPRGLDVDHAKYLVHSGFYIEPSPVVFSNASTGVIKQDDLIDLYETLKQANPQTARFITADLAFHAFHLYSDRALQKLENRVLIQRAANLLAAMRDSLSHMALRPRQGDLSRTALTKVFNFISLGLYLVSGGTEPLPIQSDIREFANNILAGTGSGLNPFNGATVDFRTFKPTGHYTRNEATQAYYRTLQLLNTRWTVKNQEDAAAVLILYQILNGDAKVRDRWHAFCDPIIAIMGGDIASSPAAFEPLLKDYAITDLDSPEGVASLTTTLTGPKARVWGGLRTLVILPHKINFDDLVYQALSKPVIPDRPLPDVLDVLAAFGAPAATLEVEDYTFSQYQRRLFDIAGVWSNYRQTSQNGANVHTDILRALRAYLNINGAKSNGPKTGANGSKQYFANSGAWEYRKILLGAAVLTELQLDTVPLYGRDFGPKIKTSNSNAQQLKTSPCGYVEPVPEVYTILASAARRLAEVLEPLLPSHSDSGEPEYWQLHLEVFAQQMGELADIAERAKNDRMTPEDFAYIHNFSLPHVLPEGFGEPLNDNARKSLRMARTAQLNVASPAENKDTGETLTLATGSPLRIFVWVNDAAGGYRVTEGYVMSSYSFKDSASSAEWQTLAYGPWKLDSEERGPLPPKMESARPSWFKKLYF